MRLNSKARENICGISLHIELIMWGDDFLDIDAKNPAEPKVQVTENEELENRSVYTSECL